MSDHDDTPGDAAGSVPEAGDPRGLDLHRRLVDRDPEAIQELWNYFDPLARYAMGRIYDATYREDVANDLAMHVIVSLIDHPERFDPGRGKGLYGYLRMDLTGDLNNYLQKMKRNPRPMSLDAPVGSDEDDVGNQDLGGNLSSDDPGPEALALSGESQKRVAEIRRQVVTAEDEGIVFDLQYVEGERSTDTFAEALGIADLTSRDQALQVQRVKDRLAKRLRRMRMERNTDERGREEDRDSTR